jgi:hypothetical protein
MLASMAINGVVLHETTTRAVRTVDGLIGITAPRRSVRTRPQAHGSIDDTRYTDESIITIAGDVWGATQNAAYAELRLITVPLIATLESGALLLTWSEGPSDPDGGKQKLVKLAGPVLPPLANSQALLSYGIILSAQDPRAYSQTLITATGTALSTTGGGDIFPDLWPDLFAASAAGTVSFTNAGNANTQPLLRVYGLVTTATVVLGTSRITLTGSVAAGDYVEIDLQARSLTLVSGGVRTNAAGMLDASASTWFSLPPGVNTLSLLASTFDASARLDVIGRSAFL